MWKRLRVIRLLPVMDFGGAESRVILQSRMHDAERFDFRVCAFHGLGAAAAEIRDAGVAVDCLDVSPALRNPRATAALVAYLRRARPDVLHCSISEAIFHGLIAGDLAGVPVRIAEEVGMPDHGRAYRAALRALYSRASAVVGVTQAVCDYVVDADGAPRDRVRRIYNCAHPRFFEAPRAPVERPARDRLRLLHVGRLHPVKNHATLLRALARLPDDAPPHELWLAGDGPIRGELERLVAELGIGDRVSFLGYREEVRDLLLDVDAFVLCSLDEGCSISLIESMATGLPPLGSDVPGIREVLGPAIAPEWTASKTDVDAWRDLLLKLLRLSGSERAAAAGRAQARAYDVFSPTRYVAEVEAMYDELAGR